MKMHQVIFGDLFERGIMEKLEGRNGYKVLNHGFVALVESMGSDLSVVRNARVSYDAEWRAGEDEGKDSKLIHYLVKNGHTSPFESVQFTFDVKAPIFVFRQHHRHRTWSYNEISARYSKLPCEMFLPSIETITTQHSSNKQMRTEDQNENAQQIREVMKSQNESAYKTYERLIELGTPRELARTVLPVAIYSHMFATVDLLNLMKFIKLRDHEHAQYEIRVYAQAMLELIRPIVPVCVTAFEKYWLNKEPI